MASTRLPLFATAVAFVLGGGAGALFADRPVDQPYAYNHAVHTAKTDCVTCHRGARVGVRAGLPDLTFCTGCHATAPGKAPTEADRQLWQHASAGDAPPWNRLYRVPEHVFFSHRRHTTVGGIECATCHGDMEHVTAPPRWPLAALKMRQCLACHERRQVKEDCTACHR